MEKSAHIQELERFIQEKAEDIEGLLYNLSDQLNKVLIRKNDAQKERKRISDHLRDFRTT